MSKKVKVGVIGAGRIGRLHIENIKKYLGDLAEIKSVADIYINNIKDWLLNLGIERIYEDYKFIINDKEIDAVLICSPTDTHSQYIMESAKEGKHIFCEKPIDFDVEKAKAAIKEVEKYKVKLQIGFQRRFDPNFKKLKQEIKNGKVGKIHILKITSRDPEPPPLSYIEVSGGIFLDMTIHDFDMARFLTESEVEEVYTSGNVFINPEIEKYGDIDTAVTLLKFENGIIGIIDNSRKSVYGYDQRIEVFGEQGSILVENELNSNLIYMNEKYISKDKPKYFFLERYKDAYVEELRSFFEAILYDRNVEVNGIDGLKATLIGLAAKKSFLEKVPIRIERYF